MTAGSSTSAALALLLAGACSGDVTIDDLDDDASLPGADAAPGADAPPLPADCREALTVLGVDWEDSAAQPGIATPVIVHPPIAGIGYRYLSNDATRASLLVDCELALALVRAAEVFAAHDVVEVADLGVYNYRCIDQTVDPPDCPGSSLSQHAHALAIDLAGFTLAGDVFYSVNDDFVIDAEADDTCAAATAGAADTALHAIVCDLHAMGIFHILLTPNYNAAHRNHFHVDLTAGADFITKPGAPAPQDE